jgi:hypothetical protein
MPNISAAARHPARAIAVMLNCSNTDAAAARKSSTLCRGCLTLAARTAVMITPAANAIPIVLKATKCSRSSVRSSRPACQRTVGLCRRSRQEPAERTVQRHAH